MPHSPEKPRKGVVEGVAASSCASGSCWTRKERCDREEKAVRGGLGVASLIFCCAELMLTVHVHFPGSLVSSPLS